MPACSESDPSQLPSPWVWRSDSRVNIRRPGLFVDRDGTLIENIPYLNDPELVTVIAGANQALCDFKNAGFAVVIVTNQSGVARGRCTPLEYALVRDRTNELLGTQAIDAVYACPYLPEAEGDFGYDHPWRKPSPGMLESAAHSLQLDLASSIMVGDSLSDLEAGLRAGVPRLVLVLTGHGREAVQGLAEWQQAFGNPLVEIIESIADLSV